VNLGEYVASFGPVAGVFLFMWFNRSQTKAEKPTDPIAKLDALIEGQTAIMTMLEILKDRIKR